MYIYVYIYIYIYIYTHISISIYLSIYLCKYIYRERPATGGEHTLAAFCAEASASAFAEAAFAEAALSASAFAAAACDWYKSVSPLVSLGCKLGRTLAVRRHKLARAEHVSGVRILRRVRHKAAAACEDDASFEGV